MATDIAEPSEPPKKALNLNAHAEAVARAAAGNSKIVLEPKGPDPKTPAPSLMADAFAKAMDKKPSEAKVVPDSKATPEPKQPDPDGDDMPEPHNSEGWKKVKTRIKDAETRLSNLSKDLAAKDAELSAAKKQPVIDPKEVETLKAERDAMTSKLETIALEQSDRFNNHFTRLFTEAAVMAKDAAGTEHAEQVEHLLQLPPSPARKKALGEIMASLEEIDKTNLALAIQQMDRARADKSEQLKNSKENLKKLREVEQREQATAQTEAQTRKKAAMENAVAEVLKIADEYEAFKTVEGDKEHNDKIAERQTWVKKFFNGEIDKASALKAPLLAQEAEFLKPVVAKLRADLAAAKTTISQMSSAQPGAGGTARDPKAVSGDEDKSVIGKFMNLTKGRQERQ